MPEHRGIAGRVAVGVGGRLVPEPAGIAIDGLGPLGLQEALQGQRHAAPLGGRRVGTGLAGRRAPASSG